MSLPLDTTTDYWRTVSDVAADSGVAASAVRFYEHHGVITGIRTAGNQRRFDAGAACRIKVAKLAQRVGFTVREIADLFADLPSDPQPQDWHRVCERLLADAEQRLASLRRSIEAMKAGDKLCLLDDALAQHDDALARQPVAVPAR